MERVAYTQRLNCILIYMTTKKILPKTNHKIIIPNGKRHHKFLKNQQLLIKISLKICAMCKCISNSGTRKVWFFFFLNSSVSIKIPALKRAAKLPSGLILGVFQLFYIIRKLKWSEFVLVKQKVQFLSVCVHPDWHHHSF